MPLDIRSAIDGALWSSIENDAPCAAYFKTGRRQKEKTTGWLKAVMQRSPADFPSLAVIMRGEPSPPQPQRTFAMNSLTYAPVQSSGPSNGSVVDVGVPVVQQVDLVITAEINADTLPIEAAVDRVLWSKWPKLGLSYCTGFQISTTRKESQINGVRCKQVQKLLTFNLRPMLSQLVAP